MYKLIGALLLICSALFCSVSLLMKEKKHIKQLDAFTELIRFICRRIEAFNMPIADIMASADRGLIILCGGEGGERDLESLLKNNELYIDRAERRIICELASGLGRSYREEQLRGCRYCSEELERLLNERKKDYPKKRKLIFTLCFCAALGIIILIV